MVRIAVSSQTPNGLDAITDVRFGRCPFFTIVDLDGKKIRNVEVIENPAVSAFGGAGIQAAQSIANKGVKVVIAENYGPNAFSALSGLEIKMYTGLAIATVKEAIEQYLSGNLNQISAATVPAHMGMGMGRGRGMGLGMGRGRGQGMGRGRGMGVGAVQSLATGAVKYCPYCGAGVPPDASFCSQCGKSL